MREEIRKGFPKEAARALDLMEQALELLDLCASCAQVGAQLDLAICRLRDVIEANPSVMDQ